MRLDPGSQDICNGGYYLLRVGKSLGNLFYIRHCEERSDVATSKLLMCCMRLPRFARNDGLYSINQRFLSM